MNNKDIKIEFFVQCVIYLLCTALTSYFSHITLGLLTGLLVYFPATFLILTIRETIHKFSRRSQNIFLLFITCISVIISVNFLIVANDILAILTPAQEGWTIYPPLTYSPPETPAGNFVLVVLPTITFLVLQAVVIFVTVRRIFKPA